MTKPFRVKENIERRTAALRSGTFPPALMALLRSRGILAERSFLIAIVEGQGPSLGGTILTHDAKILHFDLEFEGSSFTQPQGEWGPITEILEWEIQDTDNDGWWREHPRQTRPKPNNPIFVAMELRREESESPARSKPRESP